jgi:hypothetical protein
MFVTSQQQTSCAVCSSSEVSDVEVTILSLSTLAHEFLATTLA